jgi:hypothetical protein
LVFIFLTSVLLKKETCQLWFLYFLQHARKFTSIYIWKISKIPVETPKNYLSVCRQNNEIPLNFSEIYENATGGACGPRAVTVGGGEIFWRDFRPKKWLLLVDLRARILMAVV